MAKRKTPLFELLISQGVCESRAKAEALVLSGKVRIGDRVVRYATELVSEAEEFTVLASKEFVGRGGLKLDAAFKAFDIVIAGKTCADIGSSTGGFTDVLLKRGASKVYAIDVGYGELAWSIRSDPRVTVMERTNARNLDSLPEQVDFVCADVSFISLRLILPKALGWIRKEEREKVSFVVLVKPQFEAPSNLVGEGGIVRDPEVRQLVLDGLIEWSRAEGLFPQGLIASPILGAKGNKEYLLWLKTEPSSLFDAQRVSVAALG